MTPNNWAQGSLKRKSVISSSYKSMATVTITSTCSTNLTQAITFENNRADLREPSFSSYLNSSEETFVLRLAESTWKPSNTISVPKEPVYSVNAGRKKTEDGEISIFGAEKYFNGAMDEEKTKAAENGRRMNQSKKVQVKSKYGTPSTCSELSSNSQNALLAGFSATPNRQFRQNSRRFFSTFSCKCPCTNKKSVDIGKNVAENKPTSINKKHFDCGKVHSNIKAQEEIPAGYIRTHEPWFKEELPSQRFENLSLKSADREDYVSFPKSKSGTENIALQEKARNALELEVFGSPVMDKGDIGLNLQNKLTALNWDANPRTDDHATSISIEIEDDARSDSSSDLFEIKTISDNSHPFFRSQETDGMSSCASPSSCYEPSEASIEWSVVTASAANMSVVSEFGEQRSTNVTYTDKSGTNKEAPRRRSSTLLGCRSHKAVKVVAEAHKMKPDKVKSDPQRYHRSDSFKQLTRFQAETKVKDYESARVHRASATRSQAATASHTLYMT